MSKSVKYYLIQLIVVFVAAIFYFVMLSNNDTTGYLQGRYLMLSAVGVLLVTFVNGIINLFNLAYKYQKNVFLAYYIPICIWCILMITMYISLCKSHCSIENYVITLMFLEPILYNILAKKAVHNI